MLLNRLCTVSLLLLAGCAAPDPQPFASGPTAAEPEPGLGELRRELAFERHRLERRLLRRLDLPKRLEKKSCPDATLARAAQSESERTLFLDVVDARAVARDLLPTRFTDWLTTGDIERLDRRFGELEEPKAAFASDTATREALEDLRRLAARRHKGVYHVIAFEGPRIERRAWPKPPRWRPGWVHGWFAVHDLETGEALCQTELSLRNDVSGASTSRPMRPTVEASLLDELGTGLRRETAQALEAITRVLVLPPADRS
jgi:hypothetical protein